MKAPEQAVRERLGMYEPSLQMSSDSLLIALMSQLPSQSICRFDQRLLSLMEDRVEMKSDVL
jgi:hypothetical protein